MQVIKIVTILGSYFKKSLGNSLVVQWLELGTFTAGAWVPSLVRDLRSLKLRGAAKNKQTKELKVHFSLLS